MDVKEKATTESCALWCVGSVSCVYGEDIETFGKGLLISIRQANDGETFQLNVRDNDEVAVVKGKIELAEGIPTEDQKLCAPNGDLMEDDCQLSHYSIVEGSGPLLYFRPF